MKRKPVRTCRITFYGIWSGSNYAATTDTLWPMELGRRNRGLIKLLSLQNVLFPKKEKYYLKVLREHSWS